MTSLLNPSDRNLKELCVKTAVVKLVLTTSAGDASFVKRCWARLKVTRWRSTRCSGELALSWCATCACATRSVECWSRW